MVVVQALRGVQNVGTVEPEVGLEMGEQVFEVPVGRLVRTDVLGGVDRVELHSELAVRSRDAGPVDVGQDDEPEVPFQHAQCVRGVRERGPVGDGGAERFVELRVRPHGQAVGDAAMDASQQLRVEEVGRLLLLQVLALPERKQRRVAGHVRVRVVQDQRLERVPDPGLPVDQGAVAVEGQDLVVDKLAHGRRRLHGTALTDVENRTFGVVRYLYYDLAVIRSFADSKTRRLFEEDRRRGFRGLDYDRALLLLDTLDAARSLDSLRELRSVRLHALSGGRKRTSSMTIAARWRVTFRFVSGDVADVAIEAYHRG